MAIPLTPCILLPSNLQVLDPVMAMYNGSLTYADLIVLAGNVAVEAAGGNPMPFCGGRSDATNGNGSNYLTPLNISSVIINATLYNAGYNFTGYYLDVVDGISLMGLGAREAVALQGNLRSPLQQQRLGYTGSWTTDSSLTAQLSNSYFMALATYNWMESISDSGMAEMSAIEPSTGEMVYMMPKDMVMVYDPIYLAITQEYAGDSAAFEAAFADGWTQIMNADRFDGPVGSVCPQ